MVLLTRKSLAAAGNGKTTRYWDCCKPSCSWPNKATVEHPARMCDKNDRVLADQNAKNACDKDGGSAFTCTDNSPWAVNDTLAYGFAATVIAGGNEASWCCGCYKLVFTSGPVQGKTMVVQSTNTGGDLSQNHFDLLIPGGGVGAFENGCPAEFGQPFPGQRYGGVSSRSECDGLPSQALRNGCYWRFDWFANADNPTMTFEQVQCPSELIAKSGCRRGDDATFPPLTLTGGGGGNGGGDPPSGDVPVYGQCGGQNWTGKTKCVTGSTCVPQDQYYSQCLPGGSTTTQPTQPTPTPSPNGESGIWEQCGGQGWTGNRKCVAGTTCKVQNEYYSQCVPNSK